MLAEVFFKSLPKIAAGGIDHDQRDDVGFSRLHQGEGFEGFVHCAESAGEEGDGIRVFYEVQFSGEEIFKRE